MENSNAFYHIYLNVRLLPGMRMVRVPLQRESTASDVVQKCKESLNSDADYLLAADFNGFEKQFGAQERLYHLVKKQIVWAGLDRQVQFFIRKKKKQSVVASASLDFPSANSRMSVDRQISTSTTTAGESGGHSMIADSCNSSIYCTPDEGRYSAQSICEGRTMADHQQKRESSIGESWMPQLNSMSYADLMQLLEQQKRQIDSNQATVAAKEARLGMLRNQQQHVQNGQNTDAQAILTARLHQLRHQIKTEDAQLQQLRRVRAEVEDERRRSVTARIDLQEARKVFAEKERQLKEAAGRVQELMRQLDIARRRRMILNKENELSRLDSALNAKLENGNVTTENGFSTSNQPALQFQHQRPKAAIEPFKIIPQPQPSASQLTDKVRGEYASIHGPTPDYLHSQGFVAAFTAMEEVLQTVDGRCSVAAASSDGNKIYSTVGSVPFRPQSTSNGENSTSCSHLRNALDHEDNGKPRITPEYSSTQPKVVINSQHRAETPLPQPIIPKVNISINRRFQIANAAPLLYEERPPPDLIPASEKNKFSHFDSTPSNGQPQQHMENPPITMPIGSVAGSKSATLHPNDIFHSRGEADKIHLRNDTIRAAKRRSWAENHLPATTDEAEHIRLLLTRAQQKGKSSLNLSWIFDQMTSPDEHQQQYYGRQQRSASLAAAITTSYPPPTPTQLNPINSSQKLEDEYIEELAQPPPPPPSSTLPPSPPPEVHLQYNIAAETFDDVEPKPTAVSMDEGNFRSEVLEMVEHFREENGDQSSHAKHQRHVYEPDEEEEDEASAATVVEIVTSTDIEMKPPPAKGILRLKPKDESERGRRIRFDTLALLLDAALEGELDLVKSCASKVQNVSTSTEEGITALHNAICAGHYEIVRFLVEAGADVNAEDGDGWTPLHCAASCNNLPMVKFLIERGACIFATTTNDHETPADKCEEDEEGFDGCSQFLFSVQEKLGVLNGGRVYAAYEYEAEYEDELNIKADEPLLILRRDDEKEKGWWWAKRESNGEEGYIPRNYLALYPRLAAQRASTLGTVAFTPTSTSAPEQELPTIEDQKIPEDPKKENNSENAFEMEP